MASHGRFCWYELFTRDTKAAEGFYTQVLPWGTSKFDMVPGMDYTMWKPSGGPPEVGGLATPPEGMPAPNHWTAYVTVPDVDRWAEMATRLGGRVLAPPFDVPTVGRMAPIMDPQGATLNLFKSEKADTEPQGQPRLGDFSWHELYSSDPKAGAAFYCELFGWTPGDAMDMGPGGTYQLLERNGKRFGGTMGLQPGMPGSHWVYYVTVASADETLGKAEAQGGRKLFGPMDVPGGGRAGGFMDPQGAVLAVFSM